MCVADGTAASIICTSNVPVSSQWVTSGSDVYYNGGNVGIGTPSPGIQTAAGRNYLTIKGTSAAGVIELATAATDADNEKIGLVQFSDVNSVAADKKAAWIEGRLSGTTATNRGGALSFATKPDGASGLIDRMIISNSGNVGIGTPNPGAKLDVAGAVAISGTTVIDANGYPKLKVVTEDDDCTTIGVGAIAVDSNGNILSCQP